MAGSEGLERTTAATCAVLEVPIAALLSAFAD